MKLVDAIEHHAFSPEAEAMFTILASNGPTDEGMLVVVCAAAYLLGRNMQPTVALAEMEALLAHVRPDLDTRDQRPRFRKLTVVGGRDV
ncbi:hypothetical protein [Hoeflea sp.]|uniref:hypothetical protein n=1 Tax=Hoeflea sp. TaxID=1940281 RepID=UPI002B001035|nr:hypothetical protein [Hoeflea sp.]